MLSAMLISTGELSTVGNFYFTPLSGVSGMSDQYKLYIFPKLRMNFKNINFRSSDSVKEFSEVLKLLVDRHYQPGATQEDKAEAKRMLETQFEGIVTSMENDSQAEQVKTMKNMLYNIYKEGRQSSRYIIIKSEDLQ